jgi:hypothetical protein
MVNEFGKQEHSGIYGSITINEACKGSHCIEWEASEGNKGIGHPIFNSMEDAQKAADLLMRRYPHLTCRAVAAAGAEALEG